MPQLFKGIVYKTVMRPAMLYGSDRFECRGSQKAHDNCLYVAELQMLRWSLGLTLKDRVKNVAIKDSLGIPHIVEKAREKRLRLYGHIMRRNDHHMIRRSIDMEEIKRGPGMPPTTWKSTIRESGLRIAETQEHATWHLRNRRADPL
ncbi:uncharacterized protein LOC129805199 [Phlebotomus papatasi]|uniref:uncharacterized protein LOC129805199 n=1 Tax=Phlebotomus papatasi TaxID=29031 RepID=UPI002483980B|nr:uncharacterized protein LOC129805199 [Phlebotomus papatasi]